MLMISRAAGICEYHIIIGTHPLSSPRLQLSTPRTQVAGLMTMIMTKIMIMIMII